MYIDRDYHEERFKEIFFGASDKMSYAEIAYLYLIASIESLDCKTLMKTKAPCSELIDKDQIVYEYALNLLGENNEACDLNRLLTLNPRRMRLVIEAMKIAAGKIRIFSVDDERLVFFKQLDEDCIQEIMQDRL